jgi:hypothetical protein
MSEPDDDIRHLRRHPASADLAPLEPRAPVTGLGLLLERHDVPPPYENPVAPFWPVRENRNMIITPLAGASRVDLVRNLSAIRDNARNLRGSTLDQWQNYMDWAVEAERLLLTQVRDADIDTLIRTTRHGVISTNPPTGRVLIDAELDARIAALERALSELERAANRWDQGGKLVVPDTSFFMNHPTKVEETDFSRLLECREIPVRLVVPMVVVDELDSLKKAGQQQRRWRAGYAIAVLDRVAGRGERGRIADADFSPFDRGEIPRGEVTLEILLDPPGHARLPINDDEIVDRAVGVQTTAGRDVTLLTYDTGHATRGRVAGLEVKKLVELKDPGQTDGF